MGRQLFGYERIRSNIMFGRELFGVEREREIRNNYVIIIGRQLFGYERKN